LLLPADHPADTADAHVTRRKCTFGCNPSLQSLVAATNCAKSCCPPPPPVEPIIPKQSLQGRNKAKLLLSRFAALVCVPPMHRDYFPSLSFKRAQSSRRDVANYLASKKAHASLCRQSCGHLPHPSRLTLCRQSCGHLPHPNRLSPHIEKVQGISPRRGHGFDFLRIYTKSGDWRHRRARTRFGVARRWAQISFEQAPSQGCCCNGPCSVRGQCPTAGTMSGQQTPKKLPLVQLRTAKGVGGKLQKNCPSSN
jgi:hypothetical protein